MAIDPRLRVRGVIRPPSFRPPSNPLSSRLLSSRLLTAASIAVVAQSLPGPAAAQALSAANGGAPRDPWRITPSLSIDETWSDNINLASPGAERSDFVTSISPALRVTRVSPRLTATFDYAPQLLYYARGSNGTQVRNYLDAQVAGTVVENLLYFDGIAAVTQSNISPYGTLASNTVNGSGNRAETRSYSLGPTLRSHFGSDFSYSAAYRFTGSTSDNSAYAANHTNALNAQFQSGTSLVNFGYGADASRIDQTFGTAGEIVQETVGATFTYQLAPTFRLRGRVGYDRNSYPTTGQPDLAGPSYSGGFDWTPSRHTSLTAQFGHRYFGPTADVTFRETTSRFAITARYNRDQTTSTGSGLALVSNPNYVLVDQFLQQAIPDPVQRAAAVTNALQQAGLASSPYGVSDFLSNQLYLQKLVQVSVVFFGLRNTVTLDASRNDTRALSNISAGIDVFAQSQQFRSTTFGASFTHRLGPRTSASLTASTVHNQAIVGSGDTRQRIFGASVNRQLQRNLSATASYRNTRQVGGQGNFATTSNNVNGIGNFYGGDYRENAVYGSLRLTF